MSKNRSKYIIFSLIILSISFYAFLTGCKGSAGSDTPVSVYYNGNSEEPKTINVNITKEGKAVRTAAPSGKMAIEANEENTFNSNVVLTITESPSMGNESNLLSVGSIIYGITATREGLPVNTLSHPLTITLYNEDRLNGAEDYYIGIKDINGGEWQFVNLYSTNPSARTSTNFTNEFRYSIYKNNVLVALFADVKKSLKNTPKVFGSSASLTPTTLAAKKANYEEDLKVSILLAGENLSGLNAEDFKIKIAYLNSDAHDTTLKVDDKKVSYLSGSGSNKYEGFGQGYAHYFQFVPSSTKYTSGFSPTISFDINLEDIEVSKFPNSFIVEISNSDSKILPFAYSSILSFGIKDTETSTDTETETETETNTNTDTNTGTSTGVDTKATIKLNSPAADYPVTESTIELEFSSDVPWVQNDLTKITIDNNAEISNCSYNNKKLTLTLKNRLNYTSTYNVRVSNLSYAEDNSFTFTTEEKATVSLKSVASDFPIKDSPIELEFSKDIPWSVQYAEHISVDNGVNITSYQYNNKVLTLGFSGKLNYSKTYKVSVAEFEAAVKNDNLSFTTKSLNVTPVISSASQNVAPNTDDMFTVLQPKFFVNFGKEIANSDLAKSSIKLNGAALPQSCRITFDAASQTATIQFTENLEYYKEYQLSITGYTDDDGGEINSTVTALTFTTNYPEEIIGEGTQESPYLIFNETHLRKLNETTPVNYLGGNVYFKQMMNISLNDDWTPIGDDSNPFIGHYDGNDKFISGIRFNNGSADYVGFFGKVSNSTIASLTLKDVDVRGGYEFVGALVGYADNSMIEGISIKDNFFVKVEEDYCGGLVGRAKDSTIKNISGDASITISSWRYSGVIVGSSKDSDISDVHIRGTIIANSDYDTAGGLIGVISNTAEHSVKNCSVVSEETGYVKSPSNVGGLIGNCSGETNISQCYAKIPVKGTNYLGGLVGSFTSGNIINCHSNCDLTAEGSVNFVGGLVGKCSGNVATSYAEGNIRLNCTNASYIGTMIGFLGSSSSVEKSFTAVNISVADGYTPTLQRHYVPSNSNIPLWWLEDDDYIYNTSGTNYVSEGYKESLNWDSDVWDNLTEGALPTLKN